MIKYCTSKEGIFPIMINVKEIGELTIKRMVNVTFRQSL